MYYSGAYVSLSVRFFVCALVFFLVRSFLVGSSHFFGLATFRGVVTFVLLALCVLLVFRVFRGVLSASRFQFFVSL